MRSVILGAVTAVLATGCVEAFGDKDPHDPGESLGTFHLTATQTKNSCGAGALGAPESWEFDVSFATGEESLYWNSGGQVIVGELSDDGKSFAFATDVLIDMRDPDDGFSPPCSMARHDVAKGTFKMEDEAAISASGTLTYSFKPTEGSDCADLVTSETPVFAQIPCSMSYSFKAPRTGD